MRCTTWAIALGMVLGLTGRVSAAEPLADRYLREGRLAEGEKALKAALEADPKDDQARFGLGTVQFLRGVERLSQGLFRYGFGNEQIGMPLPIPSNPQAEPITYADLRRMIQNWIDDLTRAEATLSRVTDEEVTLPLHLGLFRLDIDGDANPDEETVFWKLYTQVNPRGAAGVSARGAEEFVIVLDRGDVAWLRGYCHLLMALAEASMAYDGKDLFVHCGGLIFAKVESPYTFVNKRRLGNNDYGQIADVIAAVHLMNLPLIEEKRMPRALEHLESMIALSRESWKSILAETDNDHEWIPNPKQETVMPGGQVTEEMVKGWMAFLDEAEAVLEGKKRIPFWRGEATRGVNLRRVFLEPRPFDLVLWIQGSAAVPYLEDGFQTTPETWRRFQGLFRGQFLSWAIWIN